MWTIREYIKETDFESAVVLAQRKKSKDLPLQDWIYALNDPATQGLVAEENGTITGIIWSTNPYSEGTGVRIIWYNATQNIAINQGLIQGYLDSIRSEANNVSAIEVEEREQNIFEYFGFRTQNRLIHFFGEVTPQLNACAFSIQREHLSSIITLDKELTGRDRSPYLLKLLQQFPELCQFYSCDNHIGAYLFARKTNSGEISIVCAHFSKDLLDGNFLLQHFQSSIGFQPFHLTITDQDLKIVRNLVELGMKPDPQYRYLMINGPSAAGFQINNALARGNLFMF